MALTGMLENASRLARDMRPCGVRVFHAPITFAPDGSDNPNRNLGILAGCDNERLFTRQAQISSSIDWMFNLMTSTG